MRKQFAIKVLLPAPASKPLPLKRGKRSVFKTKHLLLCRGSSLELPSAADQCWQWVPLAKGMIRSSILSSHFPLSSCVYFCPTADITYAIRCGAVLCGVWEMALWGKLGLISFACFLNWNSWSSSLLANCSCSQATLFCKEACSFFSLVSRNSFVGRQKDNLQ